MVTFAGMLDYKKKKRFFIMENRFHLLFSQTSLALDGLF